MTTSVDYFAPDVLPLWWDGCLYTRTVPGQPDIAELTVPFPCGNGLIPVGHKSDGASVGPMRKIPFFGFPKWKHPIATRRHDIRCEIAHKYKVAGDIATYKRLRKIADKMFKADIKKGTTQWEHVKKMNGWEKVKGYGSIAQTWWEQQKGYVGVRIGAAF